MEIFYQKLSCLHQRFRSFDYAGPWRLIPNFTAHAYYAVKHIGFNTELADYEKRKLGIFNLLNFLQFLTGISVALAGVAGNDKLPSHAWIIACFPALNSLFVLILNHFKKYELALLAYFILQPFYTCTVYLNGLNLGLELFFILYGILSVFFLRDWGYMVFTIAFSMISYCVLSIFSKNYQFQLAADNMTVYLVNQALAILFIFYGLFLVKNENQGYHSSIVGKNDDLYEKNNEIRQQKAIIEGKAELLKQQADELGALNILKNKLFSVIAHDLKTPMYALRTLFRNVEQQHLSGNEIKSLVPHVVNDLNYTISLMENLLQWSKTQMEGFHVQRQPVDISALIGEVVQLLRLQAEAKDIQVEVSADKDVLVLADKDMINLVLRNLLSNAIKFTPACGRIVLGLEESSDSVKVSVRDNGTGISAAALKKIKVRNYYTTNGTANESGTGLGLMLCDEFLRRNNGALSIRSEPEKGSDFSFTLPAARN